MDHDKFKEGLLEAANSMVLRSSGRLRLVCKEADKGQVHYLEFDNKPLGASIESYVSCGPHNQQLSIINFLAQIVGPIKNKIPEANKAGHRRLEIMLTRIEYIDFDFYEEIY